VEKPEARGFYENETINSRWSTRELEIRKERLLIEQEKRLGASDDDV
jgi:predicted nuclease of restriction endonuclease-like (RecB) superfamily